MLYLRNILGTYETLTSLAKGNGLLGISDNISILMNTGRDFPNSVADNTSIVTTKGQYGWHFANRMWATVLSDYHFQLLIYHTISGVLVLQHSKICDFTSKILEIVELLLLGIPRIRIP